MVREIQFRSPVSGLLIAVATIIFAACGGSATQPQAAATSVPTSVPTLQPTLTAIPTATVPTPTQTPVPTAITLPPTATPVPTPTSRPDPTKTPVSTSRPTPIQAPTPTLRPTRAPTPTLRPTLASAPTIRSPGQNAVFYSQDGLTLEYYWPLDDRGGLSGDETEILAYNESDAAIEFALTNMTFTESGNLRAKTSGTWEKFPSRASWDRIEYISIPPSPYQGQSLIVQPGEKAKIHWHLESISSADTSQSAVLDLRVITFGGTETIAPTLVRGSGLSDTPFVAAPLATPVPFPVPTQSPHDDQQSTGGDDHSSTGSSGSDSIGGTSGAHSNVRWSFNGSAWTPTGTPPDCSEPLDLQTPVDMSRVTSALWPGQQRGAYVAHGGFRFDGSNSDDITVRAPLDGYLVQASKYLEGDDEQILLFFSVPCGFFYRFDHVSGVSAKIATALEILPAAVSNDSRTTYMNPPVWIEQGEIVGTSAGIAPSNIFVDFGLYDVRQPNNAVPDPAWANLLPPTESSGTTGSASLTTCPARTARPCAPFPLAKRAKPAIFVISKQGQS